MVSLHRRIPLAEREATLGFCRDDPAAAVRAAALAGDRVFRLPGVVDADFIADGDVACCFQQQLACWPVTLMVDAHELGVGIAAVVEIAKWRDRLDAAATADIHAINRAVLGIAADDALNDADHPAPAKGSQSEDSLADWRFTNA